MNGLPLPRLLFLLAFVVIAASGLVSRATASAEGGTLTCADIRIAGTFDIQIDSYHLQAIRMLNDLPDSEEIRLSELITSKTSTITFTPLPRLGDVYRVTVNYTEDEQNRLIGWISDRERDNVCAIELRGRRGKETVNEFLQVLAIYPDNEFALGLPNTTDRIGLIYVAALAGNTRGPDREPGFSRFDL